MGLFSFIKDAGEKLFGRDEAADPAAANQAAAEAILAYINNMGLTANNLTVQYDGASSTATVSGEAADQATKEKILLCAGNVDGVAQVNDGMTCASGEGDIRFHVVESGDTLSKIAKEVYGDANKYNAIFEANKPMLSHPDKIYPGQNLRIPAL